MTDARMTRRLAGFLGTRIDEARLEQVRDERDRRGRRWELGTLLTTAIAAMAAGATSTADAERITDQMSKAMRRWLGIPRRVPDTTLRDALCTLDPEHVVGSLHAVVRAAYRRRSLTPNVLPFGVASLDGKSTAVPACDDWYAQRQSVDEAAPLVGVVRSVTTTLVSSSAKPCVDVVSIPAHTNEMGMFRAALAHLLKAYEGLDLFRLVAYDAGAASLDNANAVVEQHLHYLFCLRGTQPTLLEGARLWLGSRPVEHADHVATSHERGTIVVRRLFLGGATDAPEGWNHLRTILRVQTIVMDFAGRVVSTDNRYLMSSLPADRLTPEQWQLLVRLRWGVETTHQVLDTAFQEDEHPWIEANPRGTLVVAILRRITYTLMTLFRNVTQRSDERRALPWKTLLANLRHSLVTATTVHLAGLRRRSVPGLS
jgi:hypothetical protein